MGVLVGVGVSVGVWVGMSVAVGVWVGPGVAVGVEVAVAVLVCMVGQGAVEVGETSLAVSVGKPSCPLPSNAEAT
jgi:hypothetical protein